MTNVLKKLRRGFAVALGAAAIGLSVGLAAPAFAATGDVAPSEDGGLWVEEPGSIKTLLTPGLTDRLRATMQMDSDDDTERSLTAIFRQVQKQHVPAAAMAAAAFSPDRAPIITSAAIRADEESGVNAAHAISYVRGVRKRHILLGAHASGNRHAYKELRAAQGEERDIKSGRPLGGSMGAASINRGAVVPFTPEERRKSLPFR